MWALICSALQCGIRRIAGADVCVRITALASVSGIGAWVSNNYNSFQLTDDCPAPSTP